MSTILRIKRSEVAGNPNPLAQGELAYSALPDNGSNGGDRLYIGMGTETDGNAANHLVIGGVRYTTAIDAATNANTASTLVKRDSSGNFSAGTITASLTGDVTSAGTSSFAIITASGSATFENNVTINGSSTAATEYFRITNGAATPVTKFLVDSANGNTSISGDLGVTGALNVTGATVLSSTLGVTGATTLSSTLGVTGAATLNSTLDVTGNVTVNTNKFSVIASSGNTTVGGTLNVTGASTLDGAVAVSGNLTVATDKFIVNSTTGNTTIAGNTTVGGTFGVTGTTTFTAGVTASGGVTGNLTGNADTATKWQTARNLSLTGDATATLTGVDGSAAVSAALTLATVNSNVGSFGSTTQIPVLTVNAKGLVTAASTVNVATTLTVTGSSGSSDAIDLLTDTFTIEAGTGVTTTTGANKVTVAIGQAVNTNSDVTFNNVTVSGTLTSDDITSSSISISGDATITGNLTVQGTTTTVNSTAVAISDINLTLAKDAANAAAANGAGLTVAGANATFTYVSATDTWSFNKNIVAPNITGGLTGNADTATKWQTARDLSLTGDGTATLTGVDGSANISAALTLATVNSNVGAFGSSTEVPVLTVNAKGLVTAVSTSNIPTATTSVNGLASFSSTQFTVIAGAVSISQINGGTY